MSRQQDEFILRELLIDRLFPLVKQAHDTKHPRAGQWDRLLNDLVQTNPKYTFAHLKDQEIFQMITGAMEPQEKMKKVGSSGKAKLNQNLLDQQRLIKAFETHHGYGLDANSMLSILAVPDTDQSKRVSVVRRANDAQAFFNTTEALGVRPGSAPKSLYSEPKMTHTGGTLPGQKPGERTLSQATSFHEFGTKETPILYTQDFSNPEALAMEFAQSNEPATQRNRILSDPNTPTYGNRLRALREETIRRGADPRLWKDGHFDKLDQMFPELGISKLYNEAMLPTKKGGVRPFDRILKPGETVNPLQGTRELAFGLNGFKKDMVSSMAEQVMGSQLPQAAQEDMAILTSGVGDPRLRVAASIVTGGPAAASTLEDRKNQLLEAERRKKEPTQTEQVVDRVFDVVDTGLETAGNFFGGIINAARNSPTLGGYNLPR